MQNSYTFKNGRTIGENHPMLLIAEVASAHEGNFENLLKLIDIADQCEADAIKFQILTADSHMTEEHEIWDLVNELEFSKEEWKKAAEYVRNKTKLIIIADVYDIGSIKKVLAVQPEMVKIHSADLNNYHLINAVAKLNLPAIVGVGASTLDEINKFIHTYRNVSADGFLALMQGYQGFPTKIEDMNIMQIKMLRKLFQLPVGFLDHTVGDSEESIYLSLGARALNAIAVEKHIVIDRELKGIDHESAISIDQFVKLKNQIRVLEIALGHLNPQQLTEGEINYRQFMKKSIVAAVNISKGDEITIEKITYKRTAQNEICSIIEHIVGKKAKFNILQNQLVTRDMIE